jgi:hypothetical protein
MTDGWGPLGPLTGEWEGGGGLDKAYSHKERRVLDTPYLEKCTLKPFGPVDNGSQHLYGLDYRSAMWRGDDENPFHTEVGYWLWDGDSGEVMRGFVVPRGITVLAGGVTGADADTFTLVAAQGGAQYAIGENLYLAKNASTLSYQVTITSAHDTWSYEETTMLQMTEFPQPFAHTDHNPLHRLA